MYNVIKNLLAGVMCVMLLGCHSGFKGNGEIVSEKREVSSFNKIELNGGYTIDISQGEKQSVELTGESNILPFLETKIDGGTLIVCCKKGISIKPGKDIKIKIITPVMESLSINGGGKGKVYDLHNRDFNLDLSGSNKIEVQGKSENLKMKISGSGNVDAGEFALTASNINISGSGKVTLGNLKESNIKISGSGKVNLGELEKLNVNISGSGTVYYSGNPKISQKISGSGSLIKI